MNPQLNKLWEVVTFREFLSEEGVPDELFFYLYTRNLLFKGPQLEYLKASFEPLHLVRHDHAMKVAELVLQRFEKVNFEFITSSLSARVLKKKNSTLKLIDSAYVLRILLEYYRTERFVRYRLIRELFYS